MGFSTIRGADLIRKFEEQARGFDVHLELDSVRSVRKEGDVFVVRTASEKTFNCRAVIPAPGRGAADGGISVCATCDAPLLRDRPIAVVGGGNAAIQAAIEMTKVAGSMPMIIRCDEVCVARAKELGVRIYLRHEVTAPDLAELLLSCRIWWG